MKPKLTNQQVTVKLAVADWWFLLGVLSTLDTQETPVVRFTDAVYEALDA